MKVPSVKVPGPVTVRVKPGLPGYTEVMTVESLTILEARAWLVGRLSELGVASSAAEASLLLESLLGLTRTDLLLARGRSVSADQKRFLEAQLARRAGGEPLQHILGTAHFYGLDLRVTKDVLIPRPETERLVELALETVAPLPAPKILDVGTGSGAVALALQLERPDATALASDVSEAALAVAAENGARHELSVTFVKSDLLTASVVQSFAANLDLLVANLPYLPAGDAAWLSLEVRREPGLALFSGPDGLAHFRRLVRQAHPLLKEGAVCWLELDPRNVRQAQTEVNDWAEATVLSDLAGRERFLKLVR
ncbi:peptide chain release factor N(5)-glutamine methyltransferase [soil metagenome]